MNKYLIGAALVAVLSAPAFAQQSDSSATSSSSSPTKDCAKSMMKRHDHGSERNVPGDDGAMAMPCHEAKTASSSSSKPVVKKTPGHDHTKVHKE